LVERRLRNWEFSRAQHHGRSPPEGKPVCDFVTISRQVGSGGSLVAGQLGRQLDWPVYDKEILQAMAGDDLIRERIYASMDERDVGFLEEIGRTLMPEISKGFDYFRQLTRTVLALARGASGVFLGRAADLMLPDEAGVRVRITAPLESRARTFAQRNGLDIKEAEIAVEEIEREQEDFVRRHFGRTNNDPTRYDIILNTGRWTVHEAVRLVVMGREMRSLRHEALATPSDVS
jgi:cytidylate kinase